MLKLSQKWQNRLPRPQLCWRSRNEIVSVRNKLLGLYFASDDYIDMPVPGDTSGQYIHVFPASTSPRFEWENTVAWLKCPKDKNPYWDFTVDGSDRIFTVPFNSRSVESAADVVMAFASYFPFKPTNNFIVYDETRSMD